nr:hypothetical protein [Tanacetum cinerariifolium]
MLLLTWYEFSETTKEPVCESVTPSSLPQHDSSTPCKDSVCESSTPSQVIDDLMRQLSFDETKLDGKACFADDAGGGVDISRLSHDDSFGVADMDLNLNEHASNEVPIVEEVRTREFSVEDVVVEDYVSSGEDGEDAEHDAAFETEYDVQYSEDASTVDDDINEDFLVDEENEIVELDVDVYSFGISMDLPFGNISITNLVSDDVLKGEDMDAINADGFDSEPGNDEEKNYRKIRINLDIQVKAVQDQLQRELKVQISMSKAFRAKAKAERKIRGDYVLQYSMLRDYVVELQSTNPNTTVKIVVERNNDPSFPNRGPFPGQVLVAVGLDSNNGIYPLAYALVKAESKSSWCWFLKCLGDDIDLHPNSNFTFISDRQKVGQPRKKRKRSKHEDEPFVKDGKLSRKGRTITCQSCGNTRHNKATCKGQGRKATTGGNNAKASSSASGQAQHTKLVIGQDGSGGSGAGAIIGLFAAAGEGGAGAASQGEYMSVIQVHISGTHQSPHLWRKDGKIMKYQSRSYSKRLCKPLLWFGGGDLRDYVSVVGGMDDGDKGTDVMKDTVSQKSMCEEEVPFNNNIGKQIGDFVDMPSEAVKQRMDANMPDEIAGAKGEQVPNHVV